MIPASFRMTITGELQAVVMAGGKGSRMTDLTSGKNPIPDSRCILSVSRQGQVSPASRQPTPSVVPSEYAAI